MNRERYFILLLISSVICGCATEHHHAVLQSPILQNQQPKSSDATAPVEEIQQAAHHEEAPKNTSSEPVLLPTVTENNEATNNEAVLSLEYFKEIALTNNPTLVQATAQINAANGAAYQAGLYPNPVVGYSGEQIGVNGTVGELQGGFVSQEIVTGGKLRLSRTKWLQRVRIAETNAVMQKQRVLNDVQIQFYRTLAAQRLVKIHRELLANGKDNLQTYREKLNVGQTNQSGILRAEVDLQRDRLSLQQAENEFQHVWRTLVSLVGVPELALGTFTGKLKPEEKMLDWESALSQFLSTSPELQVARQKIRHDEISVQRERVEPIPNLLTDISVGRNFEAQSTTATVNIGISLPIFDRNQGTIQQAESDLTRSHAEARRLELELRTRLANQYRDYQTAWQHIQAYQNEMLPKAKKSYELLKNSYKARRAEWDDVLIAQRLYLNLRREHINNLTMYRESDVAVRGMLLTGGLLEPASPVSGGHIDAVPKPR